MNYSPPFESFDSWLKDQAKKYQDKPAIFFDNFVSGKKIIISYKQLNDWTNRLANLFLFDWKLKAGDKISLAFPNTPEIILINFAAWRAGLVSVPLDVSRDTNERKKYKLQFTNTKVLLANQEYSFKLPGVKTISFKDWFSFIEALTGDNLKTLPKTNPVADALVLFTSGTTSLPKGARLSLTNLWANAESIVDWLQFTNKDRWQVVLPLHHINSTTFVNTTLSAGATVVLIPQYSKSRFWQLAAKNKISGTSIVPTIAYDLLSEQANFQKLKSQLKAFKRIQLGSAPVQPTVVEAFIRQFKIPLVQGYGQTETALRSTGVPLDLSKTQFEKIRKLNSLGTNLKYTQVAILNKNGQQLPANTVGNICVRGPVVMKGYLKNKKANQEAFAYDWFHSGDTGYWQQFFGKKFFFLKGRSHEIIKKGGVLISPLAIENALLKTFPSLTQVYAVGFPDLRMGQEIGIVSTSDAPVDLLKKLPLKNYEHPKSWIKIKEKQLPKTSTGKVQRVKIRELFAQKLLEQSRTVFQNDSYLFRFLGPEETVLIKQALVINNQRWGKKLSSSLPEFVSRATHGLLLAALDKKTNKVLGSVSIVRKNLKSLPSTYRQVTQNGTLKNYDHKGDSLVCVAISVVQVQGQNKTRVWSGKKIPLTQARLKAYLNSGQDNVVRFHKKAKGGVNRGARLIKILKNSRPEDLSSLGYNILLAYPRLTKKPRNTVSASVAVQLIEAVMVYAYSQKIKSVLAYSRPAQLGQVFKN
jgi:acyl-CoA synthetase (AMP-forming)/AMP-acid ligase II